MKVTTAAISTLILTVLVFSIISVFPESISGLTRFYIKLAALLLFMVALVWVVVFAFLAVRRRRTKIALSCSIAAACSVMIVSFNDAVINIQLSALAIVKSPGKSASTRAFIPLYSVSNLAHYTILYRHEGADGITQQMLSSTSGVPAAFAGCEMRQIKLYSDFYRVDIFC
jgi:hypothetical protein